MSERPLLLQVIVGHNKESRELRQTFRYIGTKCLRVSIDEFTVEQTVEAVKSVQTFSI
jgi:hypothetical protein